MYLNLQSLAEGSIVCYGPKILIFGQREKILHSLETRSDQVLERASGAADYNSRRPSMAFSIVISSAYSISLPTGIPVAMRVIFNPGRLSCWQR